NCKEEFLRLAEAFASFNPHLTLRVFWNGELKVDAKATGPGWRKWLPSWPTCAHWYDQSRLRRYMAAHISHNSAVTVRDFISEFRGMTATAKQKAVLAEIGGSHVKLGDYFGRRAVKAENVERLLAALKQHTKPLRPVDLGVIGRDHFFARMEAAGGDPK